MNIAGAMKAATASPFTAAVGLGAGIGGAVSALTPEGKQGRSLTIAGGYATGTLGLGALMLGETGGMRGMAVAGAGMLAAGATAGVISQLRT